MSKTNVKPQEFTNDYATEIEHNCAKCLETQRPAPDTPDCAEGNCGMYPGPSTQWSSNMAFLRQCLLEARRRSGDLEGWIESMESTLGRDRTTADATLQQSAYPMSLAAAQASRSGPVPSARPQGG